MMKVYIDFETQSECDIKKHGAPLYAEHPSTQVACLAYKVDGDPLELIQWRVFKNDQFDNLHSARWLYELAENPQVLFMAHNAAFEQSIWHNHMVSKHGYPPIPINRWRCTMAKAALHGLPQNLNQCALALRLPVEKDIEGYKVMMQLCRPRKGGICEWHGEVGAYCCDAFRLRYWTPDDVPELFEKLYHYCGVDVEVTRLVDLKLRDLPKAEQRIWEIDQRMNQTGMFFDLPLVHKARRMADEHTRQITRGFSETTGIGSPRQRDKLLMWVRDNGVNMPNLRKSTVKAVLVNDDLPLNVSNALNTRIESNKTSLAKLRTIVDMTEHNGRYREMLAYHAAHTGRWGGRGVQLHNMPRPKVDVDLCLKALRALDYATFRSIYGDVSTALSSIIRGLIVAPPGCRLLMADFAQMEARIVGWLAGQQEVLDAFINGDDLYCQEASHIYGFEVTKEDHPEERQVGKVAVLALGYGGGIRAFAHMAAAYEVDLRAIYKSLWESTTAIEREKAEYAYVFYLKRLEKGEVPVTREVGFVADIIKQRWRGNNDKIKQFWTDIEACAINAAESKTGEVFNLNNKLSWFMDGIFLHCKLPSGKCTAYPYPKVTRDEKGNAKLTYHSAKYGKISTYGGKLTENVTQAVQRDLLRDALIRLEEAGYPASFHVHDEIITTVRNGDGTLSEFLEVMKAAPAWSAGIPIDVDGWEGVRYGKS